MASRPIPLMPGSFPVLTPEATNSLRALPLRFCA